MDSQCCSLDLYNTTKFLCRLITVITLLKIGSDDVPSGIGCQILVLVSQCIILAQNLFG
jgi:hypothetical protein